MDFFTRIAEHTPQLNKNDNELLSYCIRNHTEIANLKVTELADRLFISPASVVRFCKKLGFSGYSDFKASLRMDLFEPEETPRKSHPTDFFRDIHKTIEMVPEETVERIVELIHCSRRIELYAVGSSRMPGSELAKRLQTIGKAAFCYDDSTLMNISARQLTSDDLVLALSISGETSLIIAAATVAKSRGAALVSLLPPSAAAWAAPSSVPLVCACTATSPPAFSAFPLISDLTSSTPPSAGSLPLAYPLF